MMTMGFLIRSSINSFINPKSSKYHSHDPLQQPFNSTFTLLVGVELCECKTMQGNMHQITAKMRESFQISLIIA